MLATPGSHPRVARAGCDSKQAFTISRELRNRTRAHYSHSGKLHRVYHLRGLKHGRALRRRIPWLAGRRLVKTA